MLLLARSKYRIMMVKRKYSIASIAKLLLILWVGTTSKVRGMDDDSLQAQQNNDHKSEKISIFETGDNSEQTPSISPINVPSNSNSFLFESQQNNGPFHIPDNVNPPQNNTELITQYNNNDDSDSPNELSDIPFALLEEQEQDEDSKQTTTDDDCFTPLGNNLKLDTEEMKASIGAIANETAKYKDTTVNFNVQNQHIQNLLTYFASTVNHVASKLHDGYRGPLHPLPFTLHHPNFSGKDMFGGNKSNNLPREFFIQKLTYTVITMLTGTADALPSLDLLLGGGWLNNLFGWNSRKLHLDVEWTGSNAGFTIKKCSFYTGDDDRYAYLILPLIEQWMKENDLAGSKTLSEKVAWSRRVIRIMGKAKLKTLKEWGLWLAINNLTENNDDGIANSISEINQVIPDEQNKGNDILQHNDEAIQENQSEERQDTCSFHGTFGQETLSRLIVKSHWQPLERGDGYAGLESLFIATMQDVQMHRNFLTTPNGMLSQQNPLDNIDSRKFVAASYLLSQGFFWGFITIATFTTLLRIGIFAFVNHERATIGALIYASVKLLFSPLGMMILALTGMLLFSKGIQRQVILTEISWGDVVLQPPSAQRKNLYATLFGIFCACIAVTITTFLCNYFFPPVQGANGKEERWLPHLCAYAAILAANRFQASGVSIALLGSAYRFPPPPSIQWKFFLSKAETAVLLFFAFVFLFPNAYFQAPSLKKTWKRMSYGILIVKVVLTAGAFAFLQWLLLLISDDNKNVVKIRPLGMLYIGLFSLWLLQGILCYLDRFVNHITGGSWLVSWLVWLVVSGGALYLEIALYDDLVNDLNLINRDLNLPQILEHHWGENNKKLIVVLVLGTHFIYLILSAIDLFRWMMNWEADDEISHASHRKLSSATGRMPKEKGSRTNPSDGDSSLLEGTNDTTGVPLPSIDDIDMEQMPQELALPGIGDDSNLQSALAAVREKEKEAATAPRTAEEKITPADGKLEKIKKAFSSHKKALGGIALILFLLALAFMFTRKKEDDLVE